MLRYTPGGLEKQQDGPGPIELKMGFWAIAFSYCFCTILYADVCLRAVWKRRRRKERVLVFGYIHLCGS